MEINCGIATMRPAMPPKARTAAEPLKQICAKVSPNCVQAIQSMVKEADSSERAVAAKVLEWFAQQSTEVRLAVLGLSTAPPKLDTVKFKLME